MEIIWRPVPPTLDMSFKLCSVLYCISLNSDQSKSPNAQELYPRLWRPHGLFKRLSNAWEMLEKCLGNVWTTSKRCQNNIRIMLEHGSNIFATSLKCISHTSTIASSLCVSRLVLLLVRNTGDIAIWLQYCQVIVIILPGYHVKITLTIIWFQYGRNMVRACFYHPSTMVQPWFDPEFILDSSTTVRSWCNTAHSICFDLSMITL